MIENEPTREEFSTRAKEAIVRHENSSSGLSLLNSIAAALATERALVWRKIASILKDANEVHMRLLNGSIARPSWEQIKQIYKDDYAAALAKGGLSR